MLLISQTISLALNLFPNFMRSPFVNICIENQRILFDLYPFTKNQSIMKRNPQMKPTLEFYWKTVGSIEKFYIYFFSKKKIYTSLIFVSKI